MEGKLPTSVGANPGRARAKPFTLAEEYWKYKFLYDQVTRPAAGGFFVCWMILGVRHRLFFEQTLPPITRRWVAIVAAHRVFRCALGVLRCLDLSASTQKGGTRRVFCLGDNNRHSELRV